MSTVQGDIAKPEYPLGDKESTEKNGMQEYVKSIKAVNDARLKRYFDIVAPPKSDKKSRDGVIRRVKPKRK